MTLGKAWNDNPAAIAPTVPTTNGQVTFLGTVNATGGIVNTGTGLKGTFTANGVTPVVVAAAGLTANSVISISLKTVGGTVGALPTPATVTPGTGFTVVATALDTSVYNFSITDIG